MIDSLNPAGGCGAVRVVVGAQPYAPVEDEGEVVACPVQVRGRTERLAGQDLADDEHEHRGHIEIQKPPLEVPGDLLDERDLTFRLGPDRLRGAASDGGGALSERGCVTIALELARR